ncbi:SDR family oxidoreductase [Fulvivirga sp. 29W222]|uniref:SDR family oxidoreductase n=1 Tax=Fulvivirga marina TaxID=2494733 RepID=A0A937KEB1_9BACT|nr:type I polyketide synthase [Fulvivirga marina]MBL6449389.1 SDR family oxidoreductase [Fulvivirga marina]
MSKEPIAITGMSCRFPKAQSLQDFWCLLEKGEDTIEEIKRWNIDKYYSPDKGAKDKTHQRHGSMLQHIDDFDPLFFNISPAEAAEMNPSQKLMMELVWECIENSNATYESITDSKVGVYIGNIWSDFEHLRKHKHAEVTSHSAVGQSANIIANRISFFYGFSGPSLVVDTGCSSSLVALHLACQSLWDGSIEQSIVGGVNHTLDPDQNILLSKFGGLSAKGKCSTFDAGADGFVRGEGGGIILLKRLSDAERDGDKIYAVIKGTAINNNGFNENLPATSIKGQLDVLAEAYKDSGIKPGEVHYVETHGTGTPLGDPTETNALGMFFNKKRKRPLHVGSVKTNIGHLEGAAGIAGLIKAILAINHRQLPKNLNFNKPNPKIDFDGLNLKVQATHTEWPSAKGETLKAGVNSFGWGGTNGHTILEEYKPKTNLFNSAKKIHNHKFVLPISARSEKALTDYVKSYTNYLKYSINGAPNEFIHTVTATALRKPAFEFSKAFAADSKQEMIEKLDEYLKSPEINSTSIEKQKVVFVFPGQGSQWIGMGRDLYATEPIFKKAIDECEAAFSKYCNWSLTAQLKANVSTSRMNEINVIQPALCAMQIALARLWESIGLKPDAVTGHSMGEVAAAYISGSITLDEAARVICTRSKLMKTVSGKGGAMAVTELTVPEAEEIIKKYTGLSVAVNNSPKSTVIAGDQKIINELLEELERQGKFCRQVKVDVASHSAQMEPLKDQLAKALQNINPRQNKIPLYSTVKNREVSGEELNNGYWVDNLRNGVQFAGIMEELIKKEFNTFIEVSPHPVLTTAITECLEAFNGHGIVSGTLARNKSEEGELYNNFDLLYQQGIRFDWKTFYSNPKIPFIKLPSYPFQRATYALTERKQNHNTKREGHPWLGKEMKLAQLTGLHFWEAQFSIDEFPYLKDHVVTGKIVLPGVSYVEMLHAAVAQLTGSHQVVIKDLRFKSSVIIDSDEKVSVQLKVQKGEDTSTFTFYQIADGQWVETASGIYILNNSIAEGTTENTEFEGNMDTEALYEQLQTLGLQYGPYFRGIQKINVNGRHIRASVAVKDILKYSLNQYGFHPAVLDACLQTLFATQSNCDTESTAMSYLSGIETVEINKPIGFTDELYIHTEIISLEFTNEGQSTSLTANCIITDALGHVLLTLKGLGGKIFKLEEIGEQKEKWYHHINWVPEQVNFKNHGQKSFVVVATQNDDVTKQFLEEITDAGHDFHWVAPHTTQDTPFSASLDQIELEKVDHIIYFSHGHTVATQEAIETEKAFYLIQLFKDLEAKKLMHYPGLTIVTNGAFGIKSDHINVAAGPIVGIGRVAYNELSQYEPQIVDLSYNCNLQELRNLVKVAAEPVAKEREIALRNESFYSSRLAGFVPAMPTAEQISFSTSAYHLVTGYKGIAFTLVEWMFARGARKFCLVSRSHNIDKALKTRIKSLEDQGATFKIVACDVCNTPALNNLLDELQSEAGLKSIIHAAGVINAEQIINLSHEEFSSILAPKVIGAWNLHQASRKYALDHFIMFSSASSLLGLSGQVSYVAANTFLDALAQYRQKQHLPALCINWGVISDVGMVASLKNLEKFAEAEGFVATPMSDAVKALDKIFDQSPANMGVFQVNADQTAEHFPALGNSKYFSGLLHKNEDTNAGQSLLQTLESVPNSEEWLDALESHLKKLTASIIKSPEDQLSTTMKFKSLGIDSLMAVQFRNKLEKELNIKLSVTDIWEHPTIAEYATFLVEKLFKVKKQKEEQSTSEPTIVASTSNAKHKVQLVCFHDAGGNANLYADWEEKLANNIQLVTVELPGRGKSSSMQPFTNMKQAVHKISDTLMGVMDKPAIFFGHSMGGLIAFEVMRELRRRLARPPVSLIVSSTPQLASYDKQHLDHNADDQTLTKRFPHLSKEAIPDTELREILIRLLRNDLILLDSYKYEFAPPMDVNIIAIHGKSDITVSNKQMNLWKNETTLKFRFIEREGDHHYLRSCTDFVTELINNEVTKPALIHLKK